MKTEFEFERGQILENLVLLEDHGIMAQCPYCTEKHAAKIAGYAHEIAMGKEGDEKELEEMSEDYRKIYGIADLLKKKYDPQAWEQISEISRIWRRKMQGAKDHSHADTIEKHNVKPCEGPQCEKSN